MKVLSSFNNLCSWSWSLQAARSYRTLKFICKIQIDPQTLRGDYISSVSEELPIMLSYSAGSEHFTILYLHEL